MSFKASWIAIPAAGYSSVLGRLGLKETKQNDNANETLLSGALVGEDWYVVFSNDITFAGDKGASALSNVDRCIACAMDENSIFSSVTEYRKGLKRWSVEHDAQVGNLHLKVEGVPPEAFKPIGEKFLNLQNSQDTLDGSIDYLFEVPIELAANITGYRYDRMNYDWRTPEFRALKTTAPRSVRKQQTFGDIDRLFFDKISSIMSTTNFAQTKETRFERALNDVTVAIEFSGTIRKTHFHLSPFLYFEWTDQRFHINLATLGGRFKIDRSNLISTYGSGDNRAEYCLVFEDVFRVLSSSVFPKLVGLSRAQIQFHLLDLGFSSKPDF